MSSFRRAQGLSRLRDRVKSQSSPSPVVYATFNNSPNSTTTPLVFPEGEKLEKGDLILAIAVRNTNSAITIPAGYTEYGFQALTSQRHICFYKVAEGSEEAVPAVPLAAYLSIYIVRDWVNITGIAGAQSSLASVGLMASNVGLTPLPQKYLVFCQSGASISGASYNSSELSLRRAPSFRGFYTTEAHSSENFAAGQQYNTAPTVNTISAVVVEVE